MLCKEASHGWIGIEPQDFPEAFAESAGGEGLSGADFAANGRKTGALEEKIDPVPEVDGLGFIDEVGASGWFAGCAECDFCGDVCCGRIFDIGD